MALNNLSDGVGKKIVEALKMQDDASGNDLLLDNETSLMDENSFSKNINETESFVKAAEPIELSQPTVDAAFQQSIAKNLGSTLPPAYVEDFEYPANVAVLKQLITKLPAGVSKQTGALIIKQTMEALGISMSNVLQEARQVQDAFETNTKECQSNILEYKKQITILEAKVQQYQRQHAVMHDIINLFLQTGVR